MIPDDSKIVWGSRNEVAVRLGIGPRRVAQLIAKGVITETDEGIDLDRAVGEYQRKTDRAKAAAYRRSRGELRLVKPEPPAADDNGEQTNLFDFNKSKARREHYNAEKARLNAEQLAGNLISREEVAAREFSIARKLRDRLLGFPAKVANFVPPEAMKILTDEVHNLVREMQDDAARIASASQ